jgi:signal peptidase II
MEATPAATARPGRRSATWLRASAVTLIVVALDQATKALVRGGIAPGEERELLPFLKLVHVHNRGVAFGFLGNGGLLPVLLVTGAALALLVAFFLRRPGVPLLWLPTGLLLGGALGNLVDRVREGHVTDFIHLPHWPAFNVADVCITLGVVTLVLVLDRSARSAAA